VLDNVRINKLCYIKDVPKYYLLDKGVPEHTFARQRVLLNIEDNR